MMLAETWRGRAVDGWWLSEKFDGVRAYWDGSAMRTRTWRPIDAPEWFLAALPQGVALDGELWGGPGTFRIASELSRFMRSRAPEWRQMRFRLFDWPTADAIPFEQRLAKLEGYTNDVVQPVPHALCEGTAAALRAMGEVVAAGGEGVMLKRPGHFYFFGRSAAWLKLKPAAAPATKWRPRLLSAQPRS